MRILLRNTLAAFVALAAGCSGAAPAPAPLDGREAIAAALSGVDGAQFTDLGRSIWIGTADGEALYDESADVPRPAASSIKTAYLVEFFSDRAGDSRRTRPGSRRSSGRSRAPRDRALRSLKPRPRSGSTWQTTNARTVGHHMIRGTGVSNAVYNAAANLVTAFLGGPPELTGQDPRPPSGLRRHPLPPLHARGAGRNRETTTATAASLAAVLAAIARGDVPGTLSRDARRDAGHPLPGGKRGLGRHFYKGGSLNSNPITRVLSGYYAKAPGEPGGRRQLVYVFMAEIPGPESVAPGDLEAGRGRTPAPGTTSKRSGQPRCRWRGAGSPPGWLPSEIRRRSPPCPLADPTSPPPPARTGRNGAAPTGTASPGRPDSCRAGRRAVLRLVFRADGLGAGYSTVAIADGRIHTLGMLSGREWVITLDAKTGAQLWATPHADAYRDGRGDGPARRSDGDRRQGVRPRGKGTTQRARCGQRAGSLVRQPSRALPERATSVGGSANPRSSSRTGCSCHPAAEQVGFAAFDRANPESCCGARRVTKPVTPPPCRSISRVRRTSCISAANARPASAPEDGALLWSYRRASNRTANIATPILVSNRGGTRRKSS